MHTSWCRLLIRFPLGFHLFVPHVFFFVANKVNPRRLSFLASAPQSVMKGIISLSYRKVYYTRELSADLFKLLLNLSFILLFQTVPAVCVYVSQVVGVLLFPSSTTTVILVKHSCHPTCPFWPLVFLAGRLTKRSTVSDEHTQTPVPWSCLSFLAARSSHCSVPTLDSKLLC